VTFGIWECFQVGKCLGSKWMNFRVLKVVLCYRCWILFLSPFFSHSPNLYFSLWRTEKNKSCIKSWIKCLVRSTHTDTRCGFCVFVSWILIQLRATHTFQFVYNFRLKREKNELLALFWIESKIKKKIIKIRF